MPSLNLRPLRTDTDDVDGRRSWRNLMLAVTALALVAGAATAVGAGGGGETPASGNASVAGLAAEALATSTTTVPPTTAAARPTTTAPAPAPTTTRKAPEPAAAITVEATPPRPKAGETVRFAVTATQPGACCYITLEPGDGGTPAPASALCTAPPGSRQRVEFSHVYNTPGTWTVVARADAGRACDRTTALPQVTATISVAVGAGVTTSQGPAAPQVEATVVHGPSGQVTLDGTAWDTDGWVARVEIDWGDARPATVVTQAQPCRPGPNGWPIGSPLLLKSLPAGTGIGWTAAPATHTYATPGTNAVTVTAVSTGCDGGTPQRVTRTLR